MSAPIVRLSPVVTSMLDDLRQTEAGRELVKDELIIADAIGRLVDSQLRDAFMRAERPRTCAACARTRICGCVNPPGGLQVSC